MRPEQTRNRWRRRLCLEHLEARLTLTGSGLFAQYFFNDDFTGLAATRTEGISQTWGTASPGFGMDADTFSVRWTGQVEPQFSQLYTFRLTSDEGARVWLDGNLLIDDWEPHAVRSRFATMTLEAGRRYDIRVDYFDLSGSAQIDLSWASAGQSMQTIPASRLFESPPGLLGTYLDSAGGSFSRVDSAVNFNWGTAAPAPGITTDSFTANWTGQIRADYADQYTFSTLSTDGVRLWVGNEMLIDNLDSPSSSAVEQFGTKWLEPGKWYDIRLQFVEGTGTAQVALRWSSPRQTGAGVFEVVPQADLRAAIAPVFENPLGPGADPWVTYWDGNYYLARSQGNAVWINRSSSLEDIHESSGRSQTVLAWSAPPGTNYSSQIWAPELHRMSGNWYIYVAASDGNNSTHRMHVLERIGDDPFGAFAYLNQLAATTDRWAIDGTVFNWNNTWYFVWSGWPGSTDGQQNLYVAEMRYPWTLQGERVLLSSPEYAWENHGLPINEGPEILIHDGQLHIIYSASGYWTNQYALGRLTYDGVGSLLSADSWTKSPTPVFQATTQVAGPGHASFTASPDGNEHWIVYHAHADPADFNEDRVVRIQPFSFNSNGTPNFGTPAPVGQSLFAPARAPDPARPVLLGDYQADGVVNQLDYHVWRATFGMSVFPGSAADGSGDGVVDAADFVLWRSRDGAVAAAQSTAGDIVPASAAAASLGESTDSPPAGGVKSIARSRGSAPQSMSQPPIAQTRSPSAADRTHSGARNAARILQTARDRILDDALLHWLNTGHTLRHKDQLHPPLRSASETITDAVFAGGILSAALDDSLISIEPGS
jgi:GH43 family beta-xylosidase